MKKLWILALAGIISACVSTGAPNTPDLDAAIQQASEEINDTLPAGTKVALLNFTSSSDLLSDYVLEEMSIQLVKARKLTVVDRKEIDLLRVEKNFQWSGEVDDASAQEIGKLLGAESIVSGSLVTIGDAHRFRTKVINVTSAAIETSSSISVRNEPQIQALLSQGRAVAPVSPSSPQGSPQGGVQSVPVQTVPEQTAPAQPALTAYKIGDTGPAGGLIFYDKGNNSGGWRYLEAAPIEGEFQAVWSVHSTEVENTQELIGSGKRNTQLIVDKFKQTSGEWDTVAQKIDDLVLNGFDDWYLPSKAELDQMYGNLKRRNLGDFKNEPYWSSTQYDRYLVHYQNFQNGQMGAGGIGNKSNRNYARPIRQVPGPAGTTRSSTGYDGGTGSGSGTASGSTGKSGFLKILGGLLLAAGIGYAAYVIITNPAPASAQ